MNWPFATGISVLPASFRAEVFNRLPVSSDVASPEAEYNQPSGPWPLFSGSRPQNVACSGVHYNSEDQRRPLLHSLVGDGTLPAAYATDDGAGLLYRGTQFVEALSEKDGAAAYFVETIDAEVVETVLDVEEHPDEVFLALIELTAEHQSHGIGRLLIQMLLADASANGKRVRLSVLEVNMRAYQLYRRLGFVEVSREGVAPEVRVKMVAQP
jgi:ribosomal protein S18 acetylase RimI-like enzyme